MLSFDITDRNIRVVKGVESNGKIKISSAATLNLEEELIVNGHVKDVPNVATLINGILKKNKMPDKEAIVSISSNLTIFKELNVAKSKNQDLSKTVKQQMQAELNLDDSYSVTYVVVGEADEKSDIGEPIYKVLATACPYEIVNSYREVFKLLGISLRSVMVGCNCITKVLLADTKIKSKMPLLAVQIDNNFISLNLYEAGQLSFSRFASIDAADYGGSDDYVFEAVNENIFRMLQFHRSRNTGETIENVVFYGDTHDYVRLTDELEKMELQTSLINVPPQIHGHENLEFSLYANAIGAMFKRNKDTEKINLLETELGVTIKNKVRNDNAGNGIMLGAIALAAIIVGGAFAVQSIRDASIRSDIEEIDEFLNSPDTQKKLAHQEKLLAMEEKVNDYNTMVVNAHDAFYSKPIIDGEVYDAIESTLELTADELGIEEATVVSPEYTEGILKFEVNCDGSEEMVQKLPGDFVENLLDKAVTENGGFFANAAYEGYEVKIESVETKVSSERSGDDDEEAPAPRTVSVEESEKVKFEVTVALDVNESAYHLDESKDKAEDADASEKK
ncbi:MAG: pilus assembly protein PilM [Ruminococcus sp.]|nr:pilus assembly protein PilM [Ruminococcus sp.]